MRVRKGHCDWTVLFFMHSPMQRKYAVKTAHGARGVGEKIPPTRLHSPMQKKCAAKAAHGARGVQGRCLPCTIYGVKK